MQIKKEEKSGVAVLRLSGEFNSADESFEDDAESLQSLTEEIGLGLVLNCSGLVFVNSAGLAFLIRLQESLQKRGKRLVVGSVSKDLGNNIRIIGLNRRNLLPVFETESEAVAEIVHSPDP
jgi:anti-anti-sigma factor